MVTVVWMVSLGGLLSVFSLATTGRDLRPAAILLVWLACVTPALVRIDVAEHRLPNRLVLPALAAAVPLAVLDAMAGGEDAFGPLIAGLSVGGVLYACAVFGGLGMGDVKLGALLGVTAGCFGASAVLSFAVVSVCSAGLAGMVVVLAGRRHDRRLGWGTRIPFGPFLLLGCWTAVVLAVAVR